METRVIVTEEANRIEVEKHNITPGHLMRYL